MLGQILQTPNITSSNATKRSSVLPPCRICGERASGFHYGANTCEACKGFFRRCLQRKDSYVCLKNSKCKIGPGQRRGCAFCRYKKCIENGMSKTAIKTGRYTHTKRTQDILEVKSLEQQLGRQQCQLYQKAKFEELEERATRVHKALKRNFPDTAKIEEDIPFFQAQYLEKKKQREETFGQMDTITPEEYFQIFQSTGLELDDRRQIYDQWFSVAEDHFRKFISHCKEIPGFSELHLDDQITLIKSAFLECWIIVAHKQFDIQNGTFTTLNGFTFDLRKILGHSIADNIFTAVKKLKLAQLTERELGLLHACSLLSPDREFLLRPKKVEHYQMEYIETLQHVAESEHPQEPQRIAKLILILTELRSGGYVSQETKNMIYSFVKTSHVPPLIVEIMFVPTVQQQQLPP